MFQFFTKILGGKATKPSRSKQKRQGLRISLALEQLENRSLLSASSFATLATTSSNWSGYAIETNLNSPQSSSVTAVSGTWVVPAVTGSGNTWSAVWVGIDGYSSSTVEQTGIEADTVNGTAVYTAWYEMYPSAPVTISSLAIHAGDTISASVSYASGQFTLQLSDVTTSKSFSIAQSGSSDQRSSAEWIVEAPSSGFGVLPLADFTPVTFSKASATVDGTTGSIDSSSWQDAEINMASRGSLEDTTSAVNDSTAGSSTTSSFTVTYDAPTAQAPPPPRRHRGFGFFAPNLADPAASSVQTTVVSASQDTGNQTASLPASLIVQQNLNVLAAQATPATHIGAVPASASGIYNPVIRAGNDLLSTASDERLVNGQPAGSRNSTAASPAAQASPSAAWAAPAALLSRAAIDHYFGDWPMNPDKHEVTQDISADASAGVELMCAAVLAAFVTDWCIDEGPDQDDDVSEERLRMKVAW